MNYYIVQLSNRTEVEIDEEDFENVKQGIGQGGLVKVKKAILNPSFIVSVLPIIKEPTKVTKGHMDYEKGVYVVDSEETVSYRLADGFTQRDQALLDN